MKKKYLIKRLFSNKKTAILPYLLLKESLNIFLQQGHKTKNHYQKTSYCSSLYLVANSLVNCLLSAKLPILARQTPFSGQVNP